MDESEWNRLADEYHKEVVSPFYGKVENPLYDELNKIKNKKRKKAAEFGCGLFYLGDFLSKNFSSVHASDFSREMVRKALKKSRNLDNINIKKEDIRKLGYENMFDVVISVNSVIMPLFRDNLKAFCNFHKALKKKGSCFLILPSMESVLYHGMLLYHSEIFDREEGKARRIAKRKFENKKYDYFLGHYIDDDEIQKFYYKHEIEYMLRKAGFRDIKIKKVKYPWGKDTSDYEDFPEENRVWDWFAKARKL